MVKLPSAQSREEKRETRPTVWNDIDRSQRAAPPNLHRHSHPHHLAYRPPLQMRRRCTECIAPTVNPAQCYKFFGVASDRPTVQHIVRVTTAEHKPYAFQRLFRSTNMRHGRVPFFSLVQSGLGPASSVPIRCPIKTPRPKFQTFRTNRGTPVFLQYSQLWQRI